MRANCHLVTLPVTIFSEVDVSKTCVSVVVDIKADISVMSEDFRMSTTALHKKPTAKQLVPLTGVTADRLDSVGSVSASLSIIHKPLTFALQAVRK